MNFRRFASALGAVVIVTGSLLASASVAAADSTAAPGSPALVEVKFWSKLTIVRDGKSTETVGTPVVSATSQLATPNVQGPAGATIYCNRYYGFSDSDGLYSIQHACGGTTGPWGFKIASGLCSIATSNVAETGMSWTRNGASQPRQAPHNVGCNYQFHGTYNPDRDYDHIAYADVFTFNVVNNGHATLQIYGSFTTVGSPCSPTSC